MCGIKAQHAIGDGNNFVRIVCDGRLRVAGGKTICCVRHRSTHACRCVFVSTGSLGEAYWGGMANILCISQPPSSPQFNRFYVTTALTRDDEAEWPCLAAVSHTSPWRTTHSILHFKLTQELFRLAPSDKTFSPKHVDTRALIAIRKSFLTRAGAKRKTASSSPTRNEMKTLAECCFMFPQHN